MRCGKDRIFMGMREKMSQIVKMKCAAHKNIYMEDVGERELYLEIGIPEKGTDQNTGMLVLIPGYGGNIVSNVFRKMRETFSDKYNLVVMQCSYFGNCYMDSTIPEKIEKFFQDENFKKGVLIYEKKTQESLEEFNDMGIMQAMDIVNATIETLDYLESQNMNVNKAQIILFGTSHGAYLAHLANVICPELYDCLIDVSAYLTPYFMNKERHNLVYVGNIKLDMMMEYFLNRHAQYQYHQKLYDLRFLYKNMDNRCKIIVFQGADDWMVDTQEKIDFVDSLENAEIMVIQKEEVDGVFVKNADHGLGMDFLQLFQMLMPVLKKLPTTNRNKAVPFLKKEVSVGDSEAFMAISYENGKAELKHITGQK